MTKVLYHLTVLPPAMPECEALSQEINALRHHFGGDLVYLNPNQNSPLKLPRLVFGLQKLKHLRARETDFDLHHLYNPDPFPFPVLLGLRRPIVYSLSGGLGNKRPNTSFFSSLAAITVYDEHSQRRLRASGLDNVHLVRSGIDTTRFTCSPTPLQSEIRLMAGSAPWTREQFRTKGVQALLSAAQRKPELRLIFLWRGVLTGEMERLVLRMGLEEQVTVINRQVDPNQVLANVHACISLATESAIVKAYPHSLMESLAAGKPVIVSRAIPMSSYVERMGCGQVVEQVSSSNILAAIESLTRAYGKLGAAAQQVGQRDFSQQKMIDSFASVYDSALDQQQL
jgi:glycosyltransferase involved in cell wall biosynthesis